jgi:hypothetical protein
MKQKRSNISWKVYIVIMLFLPIVSVSDSQSQRSGNVTTAEQNFMINHDPLNTYALMVNKSGSGSGTVASSDSKINCGSDCSTPYNENEIVTLTATQSLGSFFDEWNSEGCPGMGHCVVTMGAAKTVGATFSLMQTGAPKMSLSPRSLNYGPMKAGVSAQKTVTISNKGTAQLLIDSISISGANATEFSQTNNCTAIAPKGTCTVAVIFNPILPFAKKVASLIITSNDAKKSTAKIKLSGTVSPSKISVRPLSLGFGTKFVAGTPVIKTLMVYDTGVSDLKINSLLITGPNASDFSQTNDCGTVQSGGNCSVIVKYTPDDRTGRKSALLVISSNDPKKQNLIVTLTAGKSRSSGSISEGSAPELSNMILSAYTYIYGRLDAIITYADRNGDIDRVTFNLYDKILNLIGNDEVQIDAGNLEQGSVHIEHDFSWLPPGDYRLEAFLTDKGGAQSNKVTGAFSASGGFGRPVYYQNPINHLWLGKTAIGDLNGDALNDVVAIQYANNNGLVLIYYQNASGGLESPIILDLRAALGFNLYRTGGLAISDMNNDGKSDLIVSGSNIVILLQDPATGQLKLSNEHIIKSPGGKIIAADLNLDGKNDLAMMDPDSYQPLDQLVIFFQQNDGTLGPTFIYPTNVTNGEIHVSDMNNDGINDIVIQSGPKELAVITQISPGIFSVIPDLYVVQTGGSSYWASFETFALGDLNNDGRNDMVAISSETPFGYINIFLQNSFGKYDQPILIQAQYGEPSSVYILDITGDGLNDIVIGSSSEGVLVFPQGTDHSFNKMVRYEDVFNIQGLSIGDVTGDGMLDAITTGEPLPTIQGLAIFPYSAQLVVPK